MISCPIAQINASSAHTQQMTRLLATENIDVIVGNYSTASFDPVGRTIQLPNWKFETQAQLDLLISHEVAHALWSPANMHDLVLLQAPAAKFVFTNVVEDIRIERKIQDKYPGLIRTYRDGYTKFIETDLFKLAGVNLSTISFVDRLNIYGKLVANTAFEMDFSVAEKKLYDQCYAADTVEEVVDAIVAVWNYSLTIKQPVPKKSEDAKKQPIIPDVAFDGTTATVEDNQEFLSDDEVDETADDQSISQIKSDIKAESQEKMDKPSWGETFGHCDKDEDETIDQSGCTTLAASNFAIAANIDTSVVFLDPITGEQIDKMIQPWRNVYKDNTVQAGNYERIMAYYKVDQAVQNLLIGFKRLKSANEYKRGVTNTVGKIDPTKLYAYKFSDQIFKSSTYFASGLSHGIIMFIDFSASMLNRELMQGMLAKTLTMVKFCRQAGIKFKVVSYTLYYKGLPELPPRASTTPRIDIDSLMLIEWFSSDMSDSEFKTACSAICYHANVDNGRTPLIETAMFAKYLVKKYQTQWMVEKMSLIIMTDGFPSKPELLNLGSSYHTGDPGVSETRFSIKVGGSTHLFKASPLFTAVSALYATVVEGITKTSGVETLCFFAKTNATIEPCPLDPYKDTFVTRSAQRASQALALGLELKKNGTATLHDHCGFGTAIFYKEFKTKPNGSIQGIGATGATGATTKRLSQGIMNKIASGMSDPAERASRLFIQSMMKKIA